MEANYKIQKYKSLKVQQYKRTNMPQNYRTEISTGKLEDTTWSYEFFNVKTAKITKRDHTFFSFSTLELQKQNI